MKDSGDGWHVTPPAPPPPSYSSNDWDTVDTSCEHISKKCRVVPPPPPSSQPSKQIVDKYVKPSVPVVLVANKSLGHKAETEWVDGYKDTSWHNTKQEFNSWDSSHSNVAWSVASEGSNKGKWQKHNAWGQYAKYTQDESKSTSWEDASAHTHTQQWCST